jgi:hypothetical protein
MPIQGKWVSKIYTTTTNQDLIASLRTLTSDTKLVARKMTVIANGTMTFTVNGGTASDAYVDAASVARVNLDADDIEVNSFIVSQSGLTLWVGVIY